MHALLVCGGWEWQASSLDGSRSPSSFGLQNPSRGSPAYFPHIARAYQEPELRRNSKGLCRIKEGPLLNRCIRNTRSPLLGSFIPFHLVWVHLGSDCIEDFSVVNERFPRVSPTELSCFEYKQPAVDFTKLSCLLPGTRLSKPSIPSKGVQIREPTNWMGVSISDLGRGYAWSDYIQLVGGRRGELRNSDSIIHEFNGR